MVGVTNVESALEASAIIRPIVSIFLGPNAYPTIMLSKMNVSSTVVDWFCCVGVEREATLSYPVETIGR